MSTAPTLPAARLTSLDAYRGFVMLAMASEGLGISEVARHFPSSGGWEFMSYQMSHVAWQGCAFWDLIQPSFMFMVGVALPYSYASRLARGESAARRAWHAVYRSLVLVFLGVFLYSIGHRETNYTFVNVLAQIGLGYWFVYLLVGRPRAVQLAAALTILATYWLAFYLYPAPGPDFDWQAVGVESDFPRLGGLFAHWNKNANFASAFDVWFLNRFPRSTPFAYNSGGYQTLNFVPSLATMIFGLMAGQMLRGGQAPPIKFRRLVVAGVICLAVGWVLGQSVCPVVKRIWTPSWAIFSTGWTCLMLAAFFWLIDVRGRRAWAFPLVVVGMNSIAMYLMAETLRDFIADTLRTHLGQNIFAGIYGPMVQSASVLLVLWLVCLWLYRRRVFIRI
jgi:predicted acyltransferase